MKQSTRGWMWEVETGCRLHCGLLETQPNQPLRFGGIGWMVHQPKLVARLQRTKKPGIEVRSAIEPLRVERVCRQYLALRKEHDSLRSSEKDSASILDQSGICIEILKHPPQHQGFGSGTQLACALVTLLECFRRQSENDSLVAPIGCDTLDRWNSVDRSELDGHSECVTLRADEIWKATEDLAYWSQRGLRSTIGLHGFLHGGWIVDKGKRPSEHVGGIEQRIDLPDDWKIILATSRKVASVAGETETKLMDQAAMTGNPYREQMWELIQNSLIKNAAEKNWELFCDALSEYGRLAGHQFAHVQGGVFRSADTAQLAKFMEIECGLQGVFQSSWGPTLAGIAFDSETADKALHTLSKRSDSSLIDVRVTSPRNFGATVKMQRDSLAE